MIGIYKITNLVTNEIYIGSSVNIKHRWADHRSQSTWKQHLNSKLYQDFQTYGLDSFEFSVIENCEIEDLKKREDFYIQSLRPQYNAIRAYNPDCLKNYQKTEEYKNYQKNYQKTSETYKTYQKNYKKTYYSKLCNFNGETLTINALRLRFSKQGIPHPVQEAKKYLAS